tara:strand:+ start:526 stop:1131 length:606 start_codon:yes stop_codon:yes gene_type:complete
MELVKYNNNSISSVTALGSLSSGSLNLITTNTISSGVSSSSFTSNINSTYDTYMFNFINLHPANNDVIFETNFSTDGGSNYNVTKTTTNFEATHTESGTSGFKYGTGDDIAQGTGYQRTGLVGSDNDECVCGQLFLFSPSSTVFVKHFFARSQGYYAGTTAWSNFMAGYCNTTSAVNAVDFKMSSGNIDSGVIKMYGLSKS